MNTHNEILIDVHGSCVSYSVLSKKDDCAFQHHIPGVKTNLYFSHVNMAGSMTSPIAYEPNETDFILKDQHVIRNIITDLKKDAVSTLLSSSADYLFIDFYDMARSQWAYKNGSYTHVADLSIAAPDYYQRIQHDLLGSFRWIDLPTNLWYCHIDRYMDTMIKKYGANHIILNRLYLNRHYIDENSVLKEFSPCTHYLGSYKENEKIRQLEEYIIQKYSIPNIDLSKYFISDYAFANDALSVHYETQYYQLATKSVQQILNGGSYNCNCLDIESTIFKLRKMVFHSDGTDAWMDYIQGAGAFSLHCYPVLDELFQTFSFEELAANREIIAFLYESVLKNKAYFDHPFISIQEKQTILVNLFEEALCVSD